MKAEKWKGNCPDGDDSGDAAEEKIVRTVPERGAVVAHSSTLTTRGMSFRRSRVGDPSASTPLCTNRCSSPSAACACGKIGQILGGLHNMKTR